MKISAVDRLGAIIWGRKRRPAEKKTWLQRLKKHWPLLLLASVCLSLLVPLLLGGLGQFELLAHLHWWSAAVFILMILFSWFANSHRLRLITGAMAKPLPLGEGMSMTAAAEFAGVATPGSLGMAGTYTYLFKQQGVSLGAAMGMLAVVVVTDLLFYGTLMPFAAIAMQFEGSAYANAATLIIVVLGVVGAGALILYMLIRYYRRIYRFLSRKLAHIQWLANRRFRLARMLMEFVYAFRLIGRMSWRQRLGLYGATVGYWLPRYGILLAVIPMLGKSVPFAYLFLVQGVLNLGGQMFILPGGGGGVDVGYAAFMSPYLDKQTLAITLLVWRTFTFYWYLVVGGLIFMLKTGKAARRLLGKAS
jgi:uncharacterized protein (TIRG00374 family)